MRAWGDTALAGDDDAPIRGGAKRSNRSRSPRRGGKKGRGKDWNSGPPPGAYGMPPAYDGMAKGMMAPWEMYLGGSMAPPAYDGMPGKGKGQSPYDMLAGIGGSMYPGMPPMGMDPWAMGKGGGPMPMPGWIEDKGNRKGKGKGKRKEGGGGYKDRDRPVSSNALDSELDAYFGKATENKAGGSGGRNQAPVEEKDLDDALEKYMSKKAGKSDEKKDN